MAMVVRLEVVVSLRLRVPVLVVLGHRRLCKAWEEKQESEEKNKTGLASLTVT